MRSLLSSRLVGIAFAGGIAAVLTLSGCGGNSSSGGSNGPTATGTTTGADVAGIYVAEVQGCTGFYAVNHYLLVGLTFNQSVTLTGLGTLDITSPNAGTVSLSYDTASGRYKGSAAYTVGTASDAMFNYHITEYWSVYSVGSSVYFAVSSTAHHTVDPVANPDKSGTVNGQYHTPFSSAVWPASLYYGVVSSSSDAKWSGGSLQLQKSGGGVVLAHDNYYWGDVNFPISPLYREGNVVGGGALGTNDFGEDMQAAVKFAIGPSGEPQSGSSQTWNVTTSKEIDRTYAHILGNSTLGSIVVNHTYDLVITSLTPGGLLAGAFPSYDPATPSTHTRTGAFVTSATAGADTLQIFLEDNSVIGHLSYQWPAWDGGSTFQFIDYSPSGSPSGTYPGVARGDLMYQVTLTFDKSIGMYTGGTIHLYVIDVNGNRTSPEALTFTLTP